MEGLTISEGPLVGQRFVALPWEREVIEAFVENRRIAFSDRSLERQDNRGCRPGVRCARSGRPASHPAWIHSTECVFEPRPGCGQLHPHKILSWHRQDLRTFGAVAEGLEGRRQPSLQEHRAPRQRREAAGAWVGQEAGSRPGSLPSPSAMSRHSGRAGAKASSWRSARAWESNRMRDYSASVRGPKMIRIGSLRCSIRPIGSLGREPTKRRSRRLKTIPFSMDVIRAANPSLDHMPTVMGRDRGGDRGGENDGRYGPGELQGPAPQHGHSGDRRARDDH